MNSGNEFADTVYGQVYAVCYEDKIPMSELSDNELTDIIRETVNKKVESVLGSLEETDKFYVNEENESVTWVYFNPDSSSGGQLVYNTFTYDQLFDAVITSDALDYLKSVSKTTLVDIDTPEFPFSVRDFLKNSETFSTRDEDFADKLSALIEPRYAIFQLGEGEELRDYRFSSIAELKKRKLYVDRENYTRVYRGRLKPGETLEDIYTQFNINRPKDFYGHSLSVSDIITIKDSGRVSAHYVDRVGFEQIHDFTLSREERIARRAISDKLDEIADSMLASDEMDDLGDKLFDYEHAPKYSGSGDGWLFGNGMTADKFEEITTRYNNGEDIRAELAKGVYSFVTGTVSFSFNYERQPYDKTGYVDIKAVSSDSGVTFSTKGGFQKEYTWEELGEAVIQAARKEFDRHAELDRQYREDLEKYGNLYLTMRDKRTIYLNRLSGDNKNYTDYRLEQIEHKGSVLTAADENNERVELRDFGIGNYSFIIHSLLNSDNDKFEVTGIEREPVFKVEANPELGSNNEAFLQAYEKTENGTTIPRDVLYIGSFEECNEYAEYLRLGEISQESVKKYYADKVQRVESKVISDYKDRTRESFNSVNGRTAEDIEELTREYINGILEDNGIDAKIVNLALTGSRSRGLESSGSDIDITVEFDTDMREDALFNILHESPFDIDGIGIDINPIRAQETGTLGSYLPQAEEYLSEKAEKTEINQKAETTIHFGLLGNGITCYDTSKTDPKTRDYPIVAHISDEGIIKYYDDRLSAEDKRSIEKQAAVQKLNFSNEWNSLPIESRYSKLYNAAINDVHFSDFSRAIKELTMAETVQRYEHSLIFKDEPYPESPRSPEEIYKNFSDSDRLFFDTNAYADILYIEGQVEKAGANKAAEQIRLSDREKSYAERFGITHDEFRVLIRYREAELAKRKATVGTDDLDVGDNVRYDGNIWRITGIDGDFSISLENVDKSSNMAVRSVIGHWKDHFNEDGFEYIPAEDVQKLQEQDTPAAETSETVEDNSYEDEEEHFVYDDFDEFSEPVQLDFFGNLIGEDNRERQIIGGVDIEQAFKYELTHYGTGFQDGKFRVEQFYKDKAPDNATFAKFLFKEYGIGGHSGNGKVGFTMHDGKGLTLTIHLGNGEKTDITWKWSKVAKRIARLIDEQEYIQQRDIDERIKFAKFDTEHSTPESDEYKRGAAVLDFYGLFYRDDTSKNRTAEREDGNNAVKFEIISSNADSIKAVKDFALATGATVTEKNPKSLKEGLYGIMVDTWESRADEIKQLAISLNVKEINEWGVHQVVSYDRDSGADDKYNYRSLSDAKKEAEQLVNGTATDFYGDEYRYDGAIVYNNETKKFEAVYGDFPVEKVFSVEVLRANGIEISEKEVKTDTEPTITCDYSESNAFESGKTYSVAEFDAAMRKADDDYVAGRQSQIEKYGSKAAWQRAIDSSRSTDADYYDVARYIGYDKVGFTVNMPDGRTVTERQDIGDGYGGVIDFLKGIPAYSEFVPILEQTRDRQNAEITVDTSVETNGQELTNSIEEEYEQELVEVKNLAALKRALTKGTEFEITSYIRDNVEDQLRSVNYADTTGIYSIRPDALDSNETLANNGRGSYLKWGNAADWEFSSGVCTAYRKGAEHTEENRLFSLKLRLRIKERSASEDISKTSAPEQTNPLVEELAKTYPADTAEQLYNAFENAKMEGWEDSSVKINRIKRAIYDILGNEDQTESVFSVLTGNAISKEPEISDLTAHKQELSDDTTTKIDYTITDEHLGEGGAKAKFAANIAAIEMLKKIESRNLALAADMLRPQNATPEEQKILAGYVGWGGLASAFDPNNSNWSKEYQQLKDLLSDDEYRAAKSSTLNAHYTTPTVINAIYKGLQQLGFEGGNILEPAMGVGNFFGVMPEEMRKNSHLSGVELDSITGRIAKQLYQSANIQIKGFEKTDFSDNYFDAVVGNVPFGSYTVSDKKYNRENFFIHDYFLAKSLDKLAPGGVMAVITTKGTMDKESPKVREYLAKRAELIGAIRLPNNAFKANAGTEVTTDILFFQKREKMAVEMPDWCYIGHNEEGVPINNYFLDHPEMIMGTMKQGIEYSLYGNAQSTACVPIEGADLKEQLEKAVQTLKLNNALRKHTEQHNKEIGIIPAVEDVRNFTYAEIDGKVYFRENNIMKEAVDKDDKLITGTRLERLKALCKLRETFRTIITAQENNCSDSQLSEYQKILNDQYDKFVKQYGHIIDRANYLVFGNDDDYNSLTALEVVNEETKEVTKADFFTMRTVKQQTVIEHVDTPQEALNVAMDNLGRIDIPYMAKICGQEPDEVISALVAENLIYFNPEIANPDNKYDGWEETSKYLSGNVRMKLRAAERAAEDNPDLQRNVEALRTVVPPDLQAGEIYARLGVHWVDLKDYEQFAREYAKANIYEPFRRTFNGEYKIPFKSADKSDAATSIFGTKRTTSMEILEALLNQRDIIVKDKVYDPLTDKDRYVINKKETEIAQEKANKMKEAFKRWLWETPERREKYVTRYNELFNSLVGRKYDGSHQTFPDMSPSIQLKPHQLNAVMRAKFGGNTLLAHCVGAGKSFEMIAATMEKKRLGLINKACVVVPKSLVGQMAQEWIRLYPQAKLLTATEKDFDKDHRQKFIGRCCTGDYDAVIMSYEQFEKIPMSFEYRRDFIQREIDTLSMSIKDLSSESPRSAMENRGSIKDMERTRKRLEAKLAKLIEDNGKKKDTSLNFEQLGFDSLVVDEAHNFKNGLVVTKMQRVAGVQTTPAQKSEDILMKTQYLNENYGEKNIIFATGTPVSNSMTELYIMQRYLRPSLLEQAGLQTFDDWASTFGEVVSKAELKPAGDGYRTKKRFAKFNNLPELMAMYKEFADIQNADMLDLPVPKLEGGKPQAVSAEPDDFQKAYMKVLAERSEKVHNGSVDASVDNMLKITSEARLLGLDARCINPNAPNSPDSKVNICIDKVMEIYNATAESKGVQAIFCDIAVHGDNDTEQSETVQTEDPELQKADGNRFSVYNYIKAELIRRGVPANEICFAGDATTQKAQNEMKAQLNSGTKRIVIASTSKLGTGANIQKKLIALHNLDIPWKPSDLEQRIGRIVRQGNDNDMVGVYNYVTKSTFDAYLMNIIVTKQKFISQIASDKALARTCEDVDEAVLNYSEIQAIASGDKRIKEKIELDTDVARLKMLEAEHYNEQYRLDDTIQKAQRAISSYENRISLAQADLAFAKEHTPDEKSFSIELGGKVYDERKAAGAVLRDAAVKFLSKEDASHEHLGSFCGFEVSLEKIVNGFTKSAGISIKGKLSYTAELDIAGDIGNITRLENLVRVGIEKAINGYENSMERAKNDLSAALASKGKPFEHAEELETKSARLEQLNLELEVGKTDEVIMNDESEDENIEKEDHSQSRNEHDSSLSDKERKPSTSHNRH